MAAGEEGEHYLAALSSFCSVSFDELRASYGCHGEAGVRAALDMTWARKCSVLGDDGITALLADARARSAAHFGAGGHGLITDDWLVVYASLMLLLGSAFDRDPLYPWARPAPTQAIGRSISPAGMLHGVAARELERSLTLHEVCQCA